MSARTILDEIFFERSGKRKAVTESRRMKMTKKSVEQILLEKAIITQEQLDKALEESKRKGLPAIKVLLHSGMVSEEAYGQAMSGIIQKQ